MHRPRVRVPKDVDRSSTETAHHHLCVMVASVPVIPRPRSTASPSNPLPSVLALGLSRMTRSLQSGTRRILLVGFSSGQPHIAFAIAARKLSALAKYRLLHDTRAPSQTHEISFLALLPRRIRLDAIHLLKQLLEPRLQRLILSALVEFAKEIAAGGEGIVSKL